MKKKMNNLEMMKEIAKAPPNTVTIADMGFMIGMLPSIIELVEAADVANRKAKLMLTADARLDKALEVFNS
jgi:hypothetical protein